MDSVVPQSSVWPHSGSSVLLWEAPGWLVRSLGRTTPGPTADADVNVQSCIRPGLPCPGSSEQDPHDEPLRFAVLCIHLSPLPRALSLRKLVSESPNTASESGAQQDGLSSPVGAWTDSPPSHWFCLGPGSAWVPVLSPGGPSGREPA